MASFFFNFRWFPWDSNPVRMMEGADETTELWRPLRLFVYKMEAKLWLGKSGNALPQKAFQGLKYFKQISVSQAIRSWLYLLRQDLLTSFWTLKHSTLSLSLCLSLPIRKQ